MVLKIWLYQIQENEKSNKQITNSWQCKCINYSLKRFDSNNDKTDKIVSFPMEFDCKILSYIYLQQQVYQRILLSV